MQKVISNRFQYVLVFILIGLNTSFAQNFQVDTDEVNFYVSNEKNLTWKGLALVVGNNYIGQTQGQLSNCFRDADSISAVLSEAGFDIISSRDENKIQLKETIRKFESKAPNYDVLFFYFSGHGLQSNGQVYIVPNDVGSLSLISTDNINEVLDDKCLNIQSVLNFYKRFHETYENGKNFFVMDACRISPFTDSRAIRPTPDKSGVVCYDGTTIIYSTNPGYYASDNRTSENGLFTKIFIEELKKSVEFVEVYRATYEKVVTLSNKVQQPTIDIKASKFFMFKNTIIDNTEAVNVPVDKKSNKKNDKVEDYLRRLGIEMIAVDGGAFQMGSYDENAENDEKPLHDVILNSFKIGKYPITQKTWRLVMGFDPPKLVNPGCDDCPVVPVSWDDVQDFIKELNRQTKRKFRLPTEAEWEFAARGGNHSLGYIYSGSNQLDEVAWYFNNSTKGTLLSKHILNPVGLKQPNELGIYDMSGLVWEWCSDWYENEFYYKSGKINPKGPRNRTERVYRGGSYFSSPNQCRVANRAFSKPNICKNDNGFRLAISN